MCPARTPGESLLRRNALSEDEFRPLLAAQATEFLLLGNGLMEMPPEQWSQRQLFSLNRNSDDLETFLDDFGARENSTFFPVREMMAMLRWLSDAMGSLVHLDARLPSYAHADEVWASEVLEPSVRRSARSLGEMILRCLEALREHWMGIGMNWPNHAIRMDSLVNGGPRPRLPRNLIAARAQDRNPAPSSAPAAARLAAHVLDAMQSLEKVGAEPVESLKAMKEFMAMRVSEEAARSYEAEIHSIQSTYDSLVAGTLEEAENPGLGVMRGSVSQALHLLEAATSLTHLYERHDVYGSHGGSRRLFEKLLPEAEILDTTINTCLAKAYHCLKRCEPVVRELLGAFTRQTSLSLPIPEGVMLHARPISLIVAVVNHHGTPVEMEVEGQRCSAASIMQMLVLAGSHPSCRSASFHGDAPVLEDLGLLFEHRLGENGLEGLPERLGYLRPS